MLEGFDDVTANIDTTSREKRVIATTISLDFNSLSANGSLLDTFLSDSKIILLLLRLINFGFLFNFS